MNKKAQESFAFLQYIPRLIFLVVVFFSVSFLVRQFVVDNLNVQEVQADVFMNRIFYSNDGISYYDKETGQTTPGIIDPKKITNENLDRMINYSDSSFIAGKVVLRDFNGNIVASAEYNSVAYQRWLPIARINVEGEGGVRQFNKTLPVNYIDDTMKPGILRMEVLLPGN